jgi:hypothetical protein
MHSSSISAPPFIRRRCRRPRAPSHLTPNSLACIGEAEGTSWTERKPHDSSPSSLLSRSRWTVQSSRNPDGSRWDTGSPTRRGWSASGLERCLNSRLAGSEMRIIRSESTSASPSSTRSNRSSEMRACRRSSYRHALRAHGVQPLGCVDVESAHLWPYPPEGTPGL